jgi:hypothetical protein
MPIPDAPKTAPATQPPPATPAAAPARPAPAAPPEHDEEFQPLAGLLAIVLPGLGHWVLGERSRAVAIAVGVLSMFFGGILIGGIDVIDSREDTIWFVGEALVGPVAFGVDYAHQNHFKVIDPNTGKRRSAYPDETRGPGGKAIPAAAGQGPPNIKSLGRMNELGTLFATLAGMLNLIAILDAAFHARRETDPAVLHAQGLLKKGHA